MDFVQTALLTVPITTAYAVGVERALPVRTILGSAARRILGRWRELAGRDHSRDVLGRLVDRCRDAESLEQLAEVLEQGANKALHVHGIATFFRSGDCFSTPAGGLPALATSSTLVGKLRGRRTISLDGWPRLSGLSLDERHWLADVGARLLVPLGGNGDDLLGFLALAEKRSEFPFSADDRGLLADVAAAGSLVARRLLENPGSEERVEEDSVAGECTACGTVSPSAAPSCPNCGGSQEPAPLPARLSQKFELERRIGTGAVGAVYRAYDRSLERVVAIKTLPRVSPESSTNLRREAKAMASLLHPNLALIFGVETWKGVPLLVLEYLAGGTLEDRIRKGPLAPSEAVRVGTKLANALDYAHGCGTLHRDVKPSNIGFDSQDVPKLLDFGLARIMSDSRGIPRDPTTGEPPCRGRRGHACVPQSHGLRRLRARNAALPAAGGTRRRRAGSVPRSLGLGDGAVRSGLRKAPARAGVLAGNDDGHLQSPGTEALRSLPRVPSRTERPPRASPRTRTREAPCLCPGLRGGATECRRRED